MATATPYDDVAYPSFPRLVAHPDYLALQGAVYGMTPPPAERCRVLELGCGTGANLVSLALTLPGSEITIHIEPIEAEESWQDSALLPIEEAQAKAETNNPQMPQP